MKIKTTTWDLNKLKTPSDPRFERLQKSAVDACNTFVEKWQKNKKYLTDPAVLRTALDEYEHFSTYYAHTGAELYYYEMALALDQSNITLKAAETKTLDVAKEIANKMLFFTHNLSLIPSAVQKTFLNSSELAPYKHFLHQLFAEARYLLSEKEEQLLNNISKTAYSDWVDMLERFLSKEERMIVGEKGKRELKSFAAVTALMSSQHKKVRDSAAREFNGVLSKHLDTAEAELNAVLEYFKTTDKMRHSSRPDELRHVRDNIETATVDALTTAVSKRNQIAKDFYALLATLFKVKKLQYHERNVPYGKVEMKYSYEKAAELVYTVFSGLDTELGNIFKMFVEEGHIDAHPKKGKRSGAFCASYLKSNPTYILLNHTDKLNDVLTIAHEAGHGVNNELIRKHQNALNFGTPVSTAEVASTFFEDFVLDKVLEKADDELRLVVMLNKLSQDISSIIRQVAFYRFEFDLHTQYREKGYLSKEEIGKLFATHMHAYMGDSVERSKGSENWWVYVSHFRHPFYVYSYASGLLISKSLQAMVKKNPRDIQKVKQFLSAGTSKSPRDIFLEMNIDINKADFWNSGLDEIEAYLKETKMLAKKLKKI